MKIAKRHRECQRMSFQWETNALLCIPPDSIEENRETEGRRVVTSRRSCIHTSELVPRTDGSWKQPEKRVRRANSERGVLTRFLRAYAGDSHSRSRDVLELVPRVNSSSWCMNKFSDSTIRLTRDYPDRKSFQRRIYSRISFQRRLSEIPATSSRYLADIRRR